MKNNILVLQARCGSRRLPGKVLKEIEGVPLIGYQVKRIQRSRHLQDLVAAIPSGQDDDILSDYLQNIGVRVFRGHETDVFSRFQGAISGSSAEVIIRSTADCPLFMSTILDEMLEYFETADSDYLSNSLVPSFPDGLDIEIFKKSAFDVLGSQELSFAQREHVTLGFYDGSYNFRIENFMYQQDLSKERWTVDYQEDFDFVHRILSLLGVDVQLHEVIDFLRANPQFSNKRGHEFRNIALSQGVNGSERQ